MILVKSILVVLGVAIFTALANCSCVRPALGSSNQTNSQPPVQSSNHFVSSIKGSMGVLFYAPEYDDQIQPVRVFNEDGSFWKEFFFYEDGVDRGPSPNPDFAPLAKHYGNHVLALKCVADENDRWGIVVNENSGLEKFIPKSQNAFKFQTWTVHILDRSAIDFDPGENPIHTMPDGGKTLPPFPRFVPLKPLKIEGDWLQVSWESPSDGKDMGIQPGTGWIRWRANDNLLIYIFYSG